MIILRQILRTTNSSDTIKTLIYFNIFTLNIFKKPQFQKRSDENKMFFFYVSNARVSDIFDYPLRYNK